MLEIQGTSRLETHVVDSGSRTRIRDALTSEGWQVRLAKDGDEAMRMAADQAPQLVIVSSEVSGAEDLLRAYARRGRGPGAVLMVGEGMAAAPPKQAAAADEILE